MSPVQMESSAPPCPRCDGFGIVQTCGHTGNCPCDGATCPRCDGTGVVEVLCDYCEERPARWQVDCDLGDHPECGAVVVGRVACDDCEGQSSYMDPVPLSRAS